MIIIYYSINLVNAKGWVMIALTLSNSWNLQIKQFQADLFTIMKHFRLTEVDAAPTRVSFGETHAKNTAICEDKY